MTNIRSRKFNDLLETDNPAYDGFELAPLSEAGLTLPPVGSVLVFISLEDGKIKQVDSAGTIKITTLTLNDLEDVAIVSPEVDDVISYNGSSFINRKLPTVLNDLDDTAISAPTTGDVLIFDGSDFANTPLPTNELSDLTDVQVAAPILNQVLSYNGSNFVNVTPSSGGMDISNITVDTLPVDSILAQNTEYQCDFTTESISVGGLIGDSILITTPTKTGFSRAYDLTETYGTYSLLNGFVSGGIVPVYSVVEVNPYEPYYKKFFIMKYDLGGWIAVAFPSDPAENEMSSYAGLVVANTTDNSEGFDRPGTDLYASYMGNKLLGYPQMSDNFLIYNKTFGLVASHDQEFYSSNLGEISGGMFSAFGTDTMYTYYDGGDYHHIMKSDGEWVYFYNNEDSWNFSDGNPVTQNGLESITYDTEYQPDATNSYPKPADIFENLVAIQDWPNAFFSGGPAPGPLPVLLKLPGGSGTPFKIIVDITLIHVNNTVDISAQVNNIVGSGINAIEITGLTGTDRHEFIWDGTRYAYRVYT